MSRKRDAYIQHLSTVPMFAACTNKELLQVSRHTTDLTIRADKVLIAEGTKGREFFVIIDGKAAVSRKKRRVATLGPGAYFGELALLDGAERNATVTAQTDMEVVVLEQREFLGLLADVPSLARKLLIGMAQRLRAADAKSVQ
jgi:CRP-like cAMP-binding protein